MRDTLQSAWPRHGDVNGDGANDVVIADYNNGLVVLLQNAAVAAPTGVDATALSSAQVLISWSPVSEPIASAVVIKAAHFQEIRNRVK